MCFGLLIPPLFLLSIAITFGVTAARRHHRALRLRITSLVAPVIFILPAVIVAPPSGDARDDTPTIIVISLAGMLFGIGMAIYSIVAALASDPRAPRGFPMDGFE